MNLDQQILTDKAIELLQELISIQSFSGEEHHTAEAIEAWFEDFDIPFQRENNNVFAKKIIHCKFSGIPIKGLLIDAIFFS